MVYYRKYRPQKIDDLDSESVRVAFQAVFRVPSATSVDKIASKSSSLDYHIPHAFLFTGPKGLGKTSSARIVAKVVNCTADPESREKGFEPCGICEQCTSIMNGTNMDVLEIDAASNRGIDEIRDLKEKIRLAPISAKKKVYIIDEVHMLTTEAFNALLKTLEEPPAHAMFILCTTEAQKVPSTILSRCFHISFQLATSAELVRSFQRIVAGEGIAVDEEALALLAGLSDGGFRDGAKLLEEVVALVGGARITAGLIEEKYKVSSIKSKGDELFGFLVLRDLRGALGVVESLVAEGVDLKGFVLQLLLALHERLLVAAGVGKGEVRITNYELRVGDVKVFYDVFSRVVSEMKFAVLPQLPLELAVVEVCLGGGSQLAVVSSNQSSVVGHQSSGDKKETEKEAVSVDGLRKQVGEMNKQKALYGEAAVPGVVKPQAVVMESSINLLDVPADGKYSTEWLGALWRGIISEMKQYNHTVAGVLRSCTVRSYTGELLVLETAYKFHKERLDDMKNRAELVKVCKVLTGKEVQVSVELKK